MTSSRDTSTRSLVLGLVLLFLLADMGVPMMAPAPLLEEVPDVARVSSSVGPVQDTMISAGSTTTNYGSSTTATIGDDGGNDHRFLLEFAHNLTTSDTVESATLKVTCGTATGTDTDAPIHPAALLRAWSAAEATWDSATSTTSWATSGADASTDRGVWEPPVLVVSTGQFSLNVTALAQDAVRDGTNLSVVLASSGAGYECSTSESGTSSDRPVLDLVSVSGSMGAGGSITVDMPADGSALMTDDLALTADTTPAVSWTAASSGLVEVQFSEDSGWFTGTVDRHLHPDDESSAYSTGSAELPSASAFTNGTTVHWRARATDSNSVVGAWSEGHVVLPSHDVTLGADGTASVDLSDLGLSTDFLEEALVDESSKNAQGGGSTTFGASMTSTREAFSHLRIHLDEVGLPANASILDAQLELTASAITGTPLISVHGASDAGWVESETTWNLVKSGTGWDMGGRLGAGVASDAIELSSSDTGASLNVTSIVQGWLRDGGTSSQTLLLTARGLNEGYTNGDSAIFHATEATTAADRPVLSVTYRWASSSAPAAPALTAPEDGRPVWNLTGHNLSGNQTPDFAWTPSSGADFLLEVASDDEFRKVLMAEDSRSSSLFTSTSTGYTPSGTSSLDAGSAYHWRMASVDSDDQTGAWSSRSFIVSDLTSTWLGGDRYELRLSHGNGTTDGSLPACGDTYIVQGGSDNYNGEADLLVALDTSSTSTVLIGCDLVSHLLPDGYAVETAELSMKLSDAGANSPVIGIWDSSQHNWTEEGATWTTYDGTNSWGTAGASGVERGSLVDTVAFGNGESTDDRIAWNVTQSVQSAMRENRSVDFIMDVTGSATGQTKYAMFYANNQAAADRAELTLVYMPGSDAVPDSPVPVSPANGSWAVQPGIEPAADTTPLLNWTYGGNLQIGGWALQLDTSPLFTSGDVRFVSSLNDAGFDLTNSAYEPQTDLDKGKTWYWRVRAVSQTNQLGNWSNVNHFLLPDTTTWPISSTSAAMELHHHKGMPLLNLPHFEDTTVRSDGQADQTHATSTTLTVGTLAGGNASALLRIPLDEMPVPSNARVTGAELSLFSKLSSDTGINVAVAPVLVAWNASANGTTYDGVNNWSSDGWTYDGLDFGTDLDQWSTGYATSTSASWMVWEIADLVQGTLAAGQSDLSLMLFVDDDANGEVVFTSLEGTASERPWLNLTWTAGTATAPANAPSLTSPADDAVAFDSTSHALLPDERPVLSWSHPSSSSIDGWQVILRPDFNDLTPISAGWDLYDSRTDAGFDLTSLTYTPQEDLGSIGSVVWHVRPIESGLYGPFSNARTVHVPSTMAGELDSDEAWLTVKYGSMVDGFDFPTTPVDTTIDEGAPTTSASTSSTLGVGLSFVTSTPSHRSSSLVGFDLSTLPLPGTYEVLNASLDLTTIGTSPGNGVHVSVSGVTTAWTSSATWAAPGSSGAWANPGGYHSLSDTTLPAVDETQWIASTSTTHSWNVTELVQAMLANGDPLSFMLQAEDLGQGIGRQRFHSSESSNISARPSLSITYRTTAGWHATAPSTVLPSTGSTLWDTSQPRPTAPSTVLLDWSSSVANGTGWELCLAEDERFVQGLVCHDSSDSASGFDLASLDFNRSLTGLEMDTWIHWMVRAEQGHRMGAWSSSSTFRHAEAQGTDDGAGNHTVVLSRGSVFTTAPAVPPFHDATISSVSATTSLGTGTTLALGQGASGTGEQSVLVEIDLSDLPWPTAMTPTQMLLRLYRTSVGSSSLTVAAFACSGFTESTVTWNTAPTCSSTEITRSTLTLTPPNGWIDFDLTSLAQSNVANGNLSMTVLLDVVGTPTSTMTFHSSEYATNTSRRPQLVLDYVDNVDGIQPPSQPSLISPSDGQVIYDTSNPMLSSGVNPTMTWSALPDATDYILTFSGPSGTTSYRSWVDSEFLTNTSFRLDDTLLEGVVYEWWVQGVNQSIPGPSSSRWSFAFGDPDTSDLGNTLYAYRFSTGNEVPDLGHTRVREAMISNASADTNFGDATTAILGTGSGCGGSSVVEACRMVAAVDFGQVPLSTTMQAHSAHLSLEVLSSGWRSVGGTTSMTLTAHRVLSSAWSELGSTWNESSPGTAWSAPGLGSGTDYGPALGSTTVAYGFNGRVLVPLTFEGMSISSDHVWIIIATPNVGAATMTVVTSEGIDTQRPIVQLNYTEVYSISVGMASTTLTAGTSGSVFADTLDFSGGSLSPSGITYTVSDGSMNGATWTPETAGQQTVTACFGAVCDTLTVTVVPNSPTTLVVTPLSTTITADDTLDVSAMVTDDWGNEVAGETITFTPSDGTMSGSVFSPMTAGMQTIEVGWQGNSITVNVNVLPGAPDQILLSGCTGTVPAGTTCDVTHVVVDQHGNAMDVEDAGGLTWSTTDGNYSESGMTYEADHVGTWLLSVTSASGASGSLDIVVGHGAMASLEITASSLSITADDLVWLNTTRIDIRGNRLPVVLPEDNWTRIADGSIYPGQPAKWSPVSRGAKVLEARYETFLSSVTIAVSQGEMVQLIMVVDSEDVNDESFAMTADDMLTASVRAVDQKGNRWSVVANWTVEHNTWSDQNILSQADAQATTFRPVLASDAPYTLEATFASDEGAFTARIFINVGHGDLFDITLSATSLLEGDTSDGFDMTADDGLAFTVSANDAEGNPIDTSTFTWTIQNMDTSDVADLTASLLVDDLVWRASLVGSWTIAVTGLTDGGAEVVRSVSVNVGHGVAVALDAPEPSFALFAGDHAQIEVTGIDADGNRFAQDVLWSENGGEATDINATGDATYDYFARRAGTHTLDYEVNGVEGTWNVTVRPQNTVDRFSLSVSADTVEQLARVTLTATAWDAFDNQIPVPPSTAAFYSDADVTPLFQGVGTEDGVGTWYIDTVNDGTQTMTVTAGSVNAEIQITVDSTLKGFFVSNSPVSYIGVGFGAIVVATLGVLLLRVLRGGSTDEWDDEDEGEDEDEQPAKASAPAAAGPTGPAPGPSGPAPGPSGPAPGPTEAPGSKDVVDLPDEPITEEVTEAEGSTEATQETNVDEDGTEWWEDENGVWWYRMAGESEWSEWTD